MSCRGRHPYGHEGGAVRNLLGVDGRSQRVAHIHVPALPAKRRDKMVCDMKVKSLGVSVSPFRVFVSFGHKDAVLLAGTGDRDQATDKLVVFLQKNRKSCLSRLSSTFYFAILLRRRLLRRTDQN